MNRGIGVLTLLLLLVIGSTAEAQFVRVGPFGGVRIRAPFFAMDVPGPPIPGPLFMPPMPPPVAVAGPYPYPYPYSARRYTVYSYPQVPFGVPSIVDSRPIEPLRQRTQRPDWTPPSNMADLETKLWAAASRLQQSLSVQRDGEIWTNYLTPNRIVAAIEQGNQASLAGLTDHYDGVAGNRQLAWLANLDGFAATRSLLHQYVGSLNTTQGNATQPQATESQAPEQSQTVEQAQEGQSQSPADPAPAEPEPAPLPLPTPLPAPAPAGDVPTPAPRINPADQARSILDA